MGPLVALAQDWVGECLRSRTGRAVRWGDPQVSRRGLINGVLCLLIPDYRLSWTATDIHDLIQPQS